VLHIGTGPSHAEVKSGPPLVVTGTNRFPLSEEIRIERLDEQLAKRIQTACEPPHYKIDNFLHDRHLYAFLRRASEAEATKYEGMGELHSLIALSRLVRPTSVGDRYSAFILDSGLEDSAIYAIQYKGISPDVFVNKTQRDWLSVQDGEELRKLMPWLSKTKPMHDRVRRAYWNHDYAMRTAYLDMRLPLVVSGLEALINVRKNDNKWQFQDRVQQLGKHFGIGLTHDDLSKAYDLRSKIVHAESFLYGLGAILPENQHNSLYDKLECLLRMTVRTCLLDENNFGNFFRDDHDVEARWLLGSKPKKPKK
jgi:hypothetical protein